MNKKIIILILVSFLFITGCNKNKSITCTSIIENKLSDYKMSAEYKITYNSDYVKTIEKKEQYKMDTEDIKNYIYESKNLEYKNLNDLYGGYQYEVTETENEVNVKVFINVEELNIKSMVNDEFLDKYYVKNNKLTLSGLKQFYKSKGIDCDI